MILFNSVIKCYVLLTFVFELQFPRESIDRQMKLSLLQISVKNSWIPQENSQNLHKTAFGLRHKQSNKRNNNPLFFSVIHDLLFQ